MRVSHPGSFGASPAMPPMPPLPLTQPHGCHRCHSHCYDRLRDSVSSQQISCLEPPACGILGRERAVAFRVALAVAAEPPQGSLVLAFCIWPVRRLGVTPSKLFHPRPAVRTRERNSGKAALSLKQLPCRRMNLSLCRVW